MKALSTERAVSMGYSSDRRKRKRQHRIAARALLRDGGFFNGHSAPGSTSHTVAQWHLAQARAL